MKLNVDKKAYMIDQVVTLDLPRRRVARQLHEAAFNIARKPLCLAAAEKIAAEASQGDTVFITTGFPILSKDRWETDGPLGAAVLCKTLQEISLKPVMITDSGCVRVLRMIAPNIPTSDFPLDEDLARFEAERLIEGFEPTLLIAIERPGWNEKHEYHNMNGQNISHLVSKTDYLFSYGEESGIATIAVGDGGNELGCGTIAETVRKHVPYGQTCQCSCGGGVAAITSSDVLVVSGVSNWGSYGISACLSILNNVDYKHTDEDELRLLKKILEAGAIDSITLESNPLVDGLPPTVNTDVVRLLSAIANL